MKKVIMVASLVVSGACQADRSILIGNWNCKFSSKYIDTDQKLTIKRNNTYKLTTKIYGADLIDMGKWSLNGKQLSLHREIHIKRGKKENAVHQFKHTITRLDRSNLTFTSGKGISTCSK